MYYLATRTLYLARLLLVMANRGCNLLDAFKNEEKTANGIDAFMPCDTQGLDPM